MDWSVWGAPIAILCFGIVAGLILTLKSQGTQRRNRSEEAWAHKDSLVDQLRSLRADRTKMTEAEYTLRFGRLLDEAALALRNAETIDDQGEPQTDIAPPERTPAPWGRRTAWAAAVLLFFSALGVLLQSYSSERAADGIMTGGDRIGPATIAKQIEDLTARHSANPDDIEPVNGLTHIALQQGDLGAAMSWIDKARAIAPDHPEVRTHLAILQTSVGMSERAKSELAIALQADPTLSKAHLWMGLIELKSGNRAAAIPSLESALEHATNQDDRSMASRALAEARRPPATVQLQGTLALAPGLSIPQSGVLFVMVRSAAEAAGPPVAAVRLDPRGIPGTFSITDRDLMMGGAWPEQVWVEARVDSDGNPSTKDSSDLIAARIGPFSPGATGATLVLHGNTKTSDTAASRLAGTIAVGDDSTVLPAGGAVFVIVRSTPVAKGPPVAAVRMTLESIPGSFTVSDADMMMGGTWPEQVWVQVRVDADGDAMTKDEADVTSSIVGPFSSGTTDALITLAD